MPVGRNREEADRIRVTQPAKGEEMHIILKGGPLDRQELTVSNVDVQYSTRVGGQRVVYEHSGEIDPDTGRHIFALRTAPPAQNVASAAGGGDDE